MELDSQVGAGWGVGAIFSLFPKRADSSSTDEHGCRGRKAGSWPGQRLRKGRAGLARGVAWHRGTPLRTVG